MAQTKYRAITQTNYRNFAEPLKHTHGEKGISCVIDNLKQLEELITTLHTTATCRDKM